MGNGKKLGERKEGKCIFSSCTDLEKRLEEVRRGEATESSKGLDDGKLKEGAQKMKETEWCLELQRKPGLMFTSVGGARRLRINSSDRTVANK